MPGADRRAPVDGDSLLIQFAKWMRSKECRIASGSPQALLRKPTSQSWLSALSFSDTNQNPLLLNLSLHHLSYLLLRFEQYGIDKHSFGPLDVPVNFQPSRPSTMMFPDYNASSEESSRMFKPSDAVSFFSWMSSAASTKSPSPTPSSLGQDALYCFSCFTKIPSLQISPRSSHFGPVIGFELLPDDSFVPMDTFKNLQFLRLVDIDARMLFGWDRLASTLRVLEISGDNVDDIQALLIDRVEQDAVIRQRELFPVSDEPESSPGLKTKGSMSDHKWQLLRRLSLSSNSLAFAPGEDCWQHFNNLVHLDLSNNLLVQIPEGLSALPSLQSLNLSNNMIESLSFISTKLGAVQSLDLSRNRIQSLAGLERLKALQSIDLRHNQLEDAGEMTRLAVVPELTLLVVEEGNRLQASYTRLPWRVAAWLAFVREGNASLVIDGLKPSWGESRTIASELAKDPVIKKKGSMFRLQSKPSTTSLRGGQTYEPEHVTTSAPEGSTSPSSPAAKSRTTPISPAKSISTVHTMHALSGSPPGPSHPSTSRPSSLAPSKGRKKKRRKPTGRVIDLDQQQGTSLPPMPDGAAARVQAHADSSDKRHSRSASEGNALHQASTTTGARPRRATLVEPDQSFNDASIGAAAANSEEFRQKVEALRLEAGQNWLQALDER